MGSKYPISDHGVKISVNQERGKKSMSAAHSRIFSIQQKMENKKAFAIELSMK